MMWLDCFSDRKLNCLERSSFMTPGETDLVTELERIGEAEVRTRLARGAFGLVGSSRSRAVKVWLNLKESERRAARETKALSISEEAHLTARKADAAAAKAVSNSRDAVSISRLAISNSRRANVIAIIAMASSVVAIITAAIIAICK
jgi:phage terminase Nu1 subunit (DNA packaging protein)